jgi:phospholipid/cholesterol/gamma-HCH transport system permease protein
MFSEIKEIFVLLYGVFSYKFYRKELLRNIVEISFFSLPVVFLTSFFTGAVLTMQASNGLSFFSSPETLATIVVSAIVKELGPVLTGLMISGRIASALAAEIATMKVSDQIEALKTLKIFPNKLLVMPKICASLFAMPILIIISDFIAFLGSWVIAVFYLEYNGDLYVNTVFNHINSFDMCIGIFKAVVFGLIITYVGTRYGLNSDGSSAGVGKATTLAVVASSILILVFNYIITYSFF